MKANEIRQKFLDFFKDKGHLIVPSAPMVIKNDPTLMFTNAGMNQFKDYFLGNQSAPSSRIADTQKCLRVSGKHNDLDEVGHDTYHHTMFEMLGNWSFGDYFKKEAIEWAWELLTEVYGLEKDRLYVTVFEGSKEDGLAPDEEAYTIWANIIAPDRIIYAPKKDNFWEMGETGPCGPCSEIHMDLRPNEQRAQSPGKELVNQDDPLVIEIWNLVFMQFNRKADKSLENLPAQHVDTGMGFERLAVAIQGKTSNYDTDVFQPMIQLIAQKTGFEYGKEEKIDIAIRVISDHIRAVAFAIADGQMPSNNKAGYVIRRILRRALRYAYTYLEVRKPFIFELLPLLSQQFQSVFPELVQQEDFIAKVMESEEQSFLKTLENGLKLLDEVIQEHKKLGQTTIKGEEVFRLYDTFGFPDDLTALVAREEGLSIDEAGFQKALKKHRSLAQEDAASETGDWIMINPDLESEFVGYDHLESQCRIIKYREIEQKKKTLFQIVLDKTPFYAESGGQVGDKGELSSSDPSLKIFISDTQRENELIVHLSEKGDFRKAENLAELVFEAKVNSRRRSLTENNHSATHLLHAALREVLGDHVAQKGSLVNEKLLRFDFSHFAKMSEEEIAQVEKIVNTKVRENIALDERRNVPYEKAIQDLGATGLFGEKYGDFVRVITFDEKFSRELCGGTHVPATGKIGLFKIISESSISAGVRRIEAISAESAENYVNTQMALIQELKDLLKGPKDLLKSVESLLNEKSDLQKKVESFEKDQVNAIKKDLLQNKLETLGSAHVIKARLSLPSSEALRQLAFDLKAKQENLIAILAAEIQGKPQIAVIISESLLESYDLNAGKLVKELAREIKGGGGGQAFYASAGGKDVQGLEAVLTKAESILQAKIQSS